MDAFAIFLFLIGSAVFAFGVMTIRNRASLWFGSIKTTANVVRWRRTRSSNQSRGYGTPIVRYIDEQGQEHEFELDYNFSGEESQRPKTFRIRYNRAAPANACRDSWAALAVFPAVLLTGSTLIILIALGVFFRQAPPGGWPKPVQQPYTRN